MCVPRSSYQKINPNSQLIIDGKCVENCPLNNSVKNHFTVYVDVNGNSTWQVYNDSANKIIGSETNELTLLSSLFLSNPLVLFWKVEFRATVNESVFGTSSIIFKTNQVPYNGSCSVDKSDGISLSDYFTLRCENWIDSDGTIQSYEFFGNRIGIFEFILLKCLTFSSSK